MKFTSRGFTLVELMIVIAIIGILAAALFPSLTAYLKRSRDAGRSANLNTIATSMGAFYSDREQYPEITGSGCITTAILSSNYLPKGVPKDPTTNRNNGCGPYGYYAAGSTGQTSGSPGWVLMAITENENGGNWTGALTPGAWTGVMTVDSNTIAAAVAGQKGTGAIFIMTN